MLQSIYAIHDQKADAYLQPFTTTTDGLAQRLFAEAVNDRQTMISKYPSDYTLFKIGEFEDSTGLITPNAPKSLGNGVEHKLPDNQLNLEINEEVN